MHACLSTTKAGSDGLIVRQAAVAGGSGARCAPDGECEGRSPLACAKAHKPCRAREREGHSPLATLDRK